MNDDHTTPIDDQTLPIDSSEDTSSGEKIDNVIGPYRLLRRIGVGGMGEVFEAEQTQPIRRRVALKVIKRGMDTHAVVARFDAERQALAMMDHPNIAKVFDAGSTNQGRPFFAMEFVEGESITDYCNSRHLGTEARLELFMRVCEGVQHAHQKAVIHRDLKPTNILVTEIDGLPQPKIIDFGVAKATTQSLTDMTMVTELGQMIGTPEYMSPEQAALTDDDIDTRTDVYALGVVLYELLAGALPFDSKELRKAGYDAVRKIICEKDPVRPSTRFSNLGEHSSVVADAHGCAPKRLRSELKGDLDWITMKALEKKRDRRYETANGLAADIKRHLHFEPVTAGPPTMGYRISKFVRRHRAGVAIASVTVFALAAFAVTSTLQAQIIAQERDRAESEAVKAEAMNEFLAEMLASADPWSGGDRDATVVQALDAAVKQIDNAFAGQPEVEASMRTSLGRAYLGLGKLEHATTQIERAIEMRTQLTNPDPIKLGNLYITESKLHQDSADYPAAIYSASQAVLFLTKAPDAEIYDLVNAYQHQSRNLIYSQRYAEAESVLVLSETAAQKLEGHQRILAAENFSHRSDLAKVRDGQPATADSLSRLAYEFAKAIDPDHVVVATYLNNAAQYHSQSGDLEGALVDFDLALELYEIRFGKDHPQYATCLENRGGILYGLGRLDETFAALEQVRDIRTRNLGPTHIDVTRTGLNMGAVASRAGNYEEALSIFRELKPILIEARGTDHPDIISVLRNEGIALRKLDRTNESLIVFEDGLNTTLRVFGENHPQTARSLSDYGVALALIKNYPEAEKNLLASFDIYLSEFGAKHIQTRDVANLLTTLYDRMGVPEKGEMYKKYAEE